MGNSSASKLDREATKVESGQKRKKKEQAIDLGEAVQNELLLVERKVHASYNDDDGPTKVFQIERLREKILRLVLFSKQEETDFLEGLSVPQTSSSSNVKSLRLVSKSWLQSVSKLVELEYKDIPLFVVRLSQSALQPPQMERLEQLPLFEIRADSEFFRKDNKRTLSSYLQQYGPGLAKLSLNFPYDAHISCKAGPMSLPNLHTLCLTFCRVWLDLSNDKKKKKRPVFHNVVPFIKDVLASAKNLQCITIRTVYPNWDPLPFLETNLVHFDFPKTLSNLELACPLTSHQCKALIKNRFPNLTRLGLKTVTFDTALFYKLFKRVGDSLETLDLVGKRDATATIRFPRMPQLKNLSLTGGTWHWDTKNKCKMDDALKSLESLHFQHISDGNVTGRWSSTTVTTLRGELTDSYFWRSSNGICILHQNFPNVSNLSLKICGTTAIEQVGYLWKYWTQLKTLSLEVYGTGYPMAVGTHYWDTLLTGIPPGWVKTLRENPLATWEPGDNTTRENVKPSIRNLKELTTFQIFNIGSLREISNVRLISHVSFEYGFMKMPNLKEIKFTGKFKPCPVLMQLWSERNDKI